MHARIETITPKMLLGKHLRMSLSGDRTTQLWQSFMPLRKQITNMVGNDLYSVTRYDEPDFKNFNHNTGFEKWAAVEVSSFDNVPGDLETCELVGGMYAVFIYQGAANAFGNTLYNIITTWLPGSGYSLDNSRAHFFVMGEKYKGNDPSSEEEFWLPVIEK